MLPPLLLPLLLLLLLSLLCPVQTVQQFLVQPSDTSVLRGDRVVLPCRVRAKNGALQWTRDEFGLGQDRSLPGFPRMRMVGQDPAQDWDLEINPVELADEADYQCQVLSTDPAQTIRSNTARLEVRSQCSRPVITGGPVLGLQEGVHTQVQCSCRGARPPARLEWRLAHQGTVAGNTSVIGEVGQLTYRTVSTLEVVGSRERDGGRITCRVAGRPNTETEIRLSVTFLPRVEILGAGQEAGLKAGGRAMLECRAVARPEVEDWGWRLGGEDVLGDRAHLVIEELDSNLQGAEVECWGENRLGRGRAKARLYLHVAPRIVTPPQNVRVRSGEVAVLRCQAEGHPPPSITWHKEDGSEVWAGAALSLLVTATTEGRYHCTASSPSFLPVSSLPVWVSLARTPVFLSSTPQSSILPSLQVRCSAKKGGQPEVTWRFGGKLINSGTRYVITHTEEEDSITWLLTINNASTADFGLYTCTVENDVGSSSIEILLEEGVPGAVLGLQLGLGLAGILSCVFVIGVTAWFCRNLSRAAAKVQEEEEEETSTPPDGTELRRRRSKSPEPEFRIPGEAGPVLHTIRPDFAAFYGNPHLSSHLATMENDEEAEKEVQIQFQSLYGDPGLLRGKQHTAPRSPPSSGTKSVYFSDPPVQRRRYEPSVLSSEASTSVYSEPLLGYGDLSYSVLQLDCSVEEDDITTLAD